MYAADKSGHTCFTRSANSASDIQHAHESTPMLSSEVGPRDVCFAPLKKVSVPRTPAFSSYSFGVRSGIPSPHKVIMVVGATGTGKSTLINTMINYILGVKREDDFRFKLVHEPGTGTQSQADSQTQHITSYTIHNNGHMNVPYTLTIIDTPGFRDARGIERDRAIVEQIREFFSHPEAHGVIHIDAVGFVVQSSQERLTPTQRYIFESILGIFGKDIKPNILLLITFCDRQTPTVLEAVQEARLPFGKTFKFNNSALFVGQGDGGMSLDAMLWHMGYKSMHEFFDALDGLQPRSLSLTVEVLEERKRLEIDLKGLQPQIQIACEQTELLNGLKEMLEKHKMEIEENKPFTYEVEVTKLEKIPCPGKGSTNCPKCLFSCHYPCTFSHLKFLCHAMSWGKCTVCPGKCSSMNHVHEYFTYRWITVKEKQTYADIENRYRDAQGRKQTREAVIKEVEADLANAEAAVDELIKESHRCTQRLEEIALRPTSVCVIEYMDMLIKTEKAAKYTGWEKRVGSLEATKQRENSKAMKDAASSDNAVSIMWNKIVKQFGF